METLDGHQAPAKEAGSVTRYDVGELKRAYRTPEGYLLCEGYATRVGVFDYMNVDGSMRRELRLPDEVGNPESLGTLGRKPVTLQHPPELVHANNIDRYGVGDIGEDVVFEQADGYVKVRLAVRRGDAVDAVDRGSRELSCGYLCDLDMTPGTWQGQAYDAIQRHIRYNHLAIVDRGRAGHDVKLRADSDDAVMVTAEPQEATMPEPKTASVEIGGVRYDGLDHELAKTIAAEAKGNKEALAKKDQEKADSLSEKDKAIEKVRADEATYKAQLDTAKKDLETKAGEMEALKTKIVALEAKVAAKEKALEDAKKGDQEDFLPRFNERLRLLTLAGKLKVDKEGDTLDNAALKKAVVTASNKDLNLEGRSDAFIDGYIEKLAADLIKADADLTATARDLAGLTADGRAADPPKDFAAERKDAMAEYLKSTYGSDSK